MVDCKSLGPHLLKVAFEVIGSAINGHSGVEGGYPIWTGQLLRVLVIFTIVDMMIYNNIGNPKFTRFGVMDFVNSPEYQL